MVPASVNGIQKYLGSGLIKGIGPVMAKRIVKKFGKDTLDVIEADAEKLSAVEGIGIKRIQMIKKAWADQKEIREVMIFLQSHGVSSGYATKIFKQYGNEAIKVVKENPYRLATDIFGIGFITADKIPEKLGFGKDSELRAQAGILYVLRELSDEGHVYYPYEFHTGRSHSHPLSFGRHLLQSENGINFKVDTLRSPGLVHFEGSILPSGVLATLLETGILFGEGARSAAALPGDTLAAIGVLDGLDAPRGGPARGRFP
jgi:hypothetical protein